MAVHAALEVARGIDDPDRAGRAWSSPTAGARYLSKIFNDAWMTQHGFLERAGGQTVGDVLRAKQDARRDPAARERPRPRRVRDAVALLHEHRVSQLPVVSAHDRAGHRRLDRRARAAAPRGRGPRRCSARRSSTSWRRRSRPSPSTDDVRDAVELLAGERQALLVTDDGRPVGIVTRADLLEALAR